jgi:hypothetical protein
MGKLSKIEIIFVISAHLTWFKVFGPAAFYHSATILVLNSGVVVQEDGPVKAVREQRRLEEETISSLRGRLEELESYAYQVTLCTL